MQQNELRKDGPQIVWHQVARNKSGATLAERDIPISSVPDDHLVEEFAEFSASSRGDRYTSIGMALNEIQSQSKELIDKVYSAEGLEDIDNYAPLLSRAVPLFRALDSYYVQLFERRTGTYGD